MDQFGAGTVGPGRDAHPTELLDRPGIQDRDVGAVVEQLFHLGRRHARRAVGVLDVLAERLGWHVHAAVHLAPTGSPRLDTTIEDEDVRPAELDGTLRCPFGEIADAVVAPDHPCRTAWHQPR